MKNKNCWMCGEEIIEGVANAIFNKAGDMLCLHKKCVPLLTMRDKKRGTVPDYSMSDITDRN